MNEQAIVTVDSAAAATSEPQQVSAELPDLVSENVKSLEATLGELIQKIKDDPAMPQVGVLSGKGFLQGFNLIADDVMRLANDHVDRAERTRVEAEALAAEIRRCGSLFCRRVEEEAVRGFQVSRIVREARRMIADS